jgi:hypothetical protein
MRELPDWCIYVACFVAGMVATGSVLRWCGVERTLALRISFAGGVAAVLAWALVEARIEREWRRCIEKHSQEAPPDQERA